VAHPVVLASASPRRLDLLERLGVDVVVDPADVDETLRAGEPAVAYVRRLAAAKVARVAARHADDQLVVGADTTVELDGRVLGKPDDAAHAAAMLRDLSGRTHRVHTGVAVRHRGRTLDDVVTSLVRFEPLSPATIAWYVATGEPLDKAGAYAVQGVGAVLVAEVRGSVSNVVGLPLATVVGLARRHGVALGTIDDVPEIVPPAGRAR
jgi:septum formation protein